MKKNLLLQILILCSYAPTFAQDIECGNGVFYGLSASNQVYKMTLSGNTITLNGMVAPAPPNASYALAISHGVNGTNAFYSCNNLNQLIQYDGTQWQALFTDTAVFVNAAGNDTALYYQQLGLPNLERNRISRFNNGNLTLLWHDSVSIPVSDIAVDSAANVYFFTGTTGNQVLHIMSASGAIIDSFPAAFSNTTAYGCLFMNGRLYVGVGATNTPASRLLLPITISGGTAVVGTGIQMPAPVIGGTLGNPLYLDFKDLANCHEKNILPLTLLAFSAFHSGSMKNKLFWKVADNATIATFEPQYSNDDNHFESIVKVDAGPAAFNAGYNYEHLVSATANIFYRLKITDRQGNIEYSKVVRLSPDKHAIGKLYPNPAEEELFIEYAGKASNVHVKITDLAGRIVYAEDLPAAELIRARLNFQAGQYFITINDGEEVLTKKLIKL